MLVTANTKPKERIFFGSWKEHEVEKNVRVPWGSLTKALPDSWSATKIAGLVLDTGWEPIEKQMNFVQVHYQNTRLNRQAG